MDSSPTTTRQGISVGAYGPDSLSGLAPPYTELLVREDNCFEMNVNIPNHNIRSETVASLGECEALCHEEDNCVAFLFLRNTQECYLKDGVTTKLEVDSMDSIVGYKDCGNVAEVELSLRKDTH